MNQDLFSEFKGSSDQEVRAQIQKDLNSLDFESTLCWESLEGIITQPFYDRNSEKQKKIINAFPESWNTAHTIEVKQDIESVIRSCEAAVQSDVEVIILRLKDSDLSFEQFSKALEHLQTTFYIVLDFNLSTECLDLITNNFKDKVNFTFLFDPITHLAQTGDWLVDRHSDLALWSQLTCSKELQTRLYVDNRIHQNAGATIVQQLAYSLSQAVDYLSQINPANEEDVELLFHLALGSNYFFEIAKIQALKTVFTSIVLAYDFKITFKLIAEPSTRNMTLQDYNVNMLRSTTAMMAAILGGADIINNLPYDVTFNPPNAFGDRIAQNQLLILKNESFFNQVTNPAEGSYYIEELTQEFAERSLHFFQDIEKKEGFLDLLLNNEIQKEVSRAAQKEQALFDSEALVLVGVNRFQDFDAPKTNMQIPIEQARKQSLIEPIQSRRLSEKSEQVYGK